MAAREETEMALRPTNVGKEREDEEANQSDSDSDDGGSKSLLEVGTASEGAMVVNIITGGLGTGILCLPWLTAGGSIIVTLVVTALILAINAWTLFLLVEASDKYQQYDLGSLLESIPDCGPVVNKATNLLVAVSVFLTCMSYIVTMNEQVQNVLLGNMEVADYKCTWLVMMITGVIVLPLCYLDQRRLAFTSTLTVFVFIVLMVLLIIELCNSEKTTEVVWFGYGEGSVTLLAGISNCITIQVCMLPMYAELEDRTPAKMNRVITKSFVALYAMFAAYAVVGYLAFGADVRESVTSSMAKVWYNDVGRFGIFVALLGVYPILLKGITGPLQSYVSDGTLQVAIVVIVAATVLASIPFFDDLGKINTVNGAICCGVCCCCVPGLVGLLFLERNRILMYTLIVAGPATMTLGILYADQNYASSLRQLF